MADILPFSRALRERTRTGHEHSETSGFMADLLSGKGTVQDYIALVSQHYAIYRSLEAGAELVRHDPIVAPFLSPQLTRLPAIEEDLRFLVGEYWRERIVTLPATARYARRIDEVAASWPNGFVAHHYTRYLGDLSGGQVIRTMVQRQFGFETNGVGFYLFDQIAKPREFKDAYRAQLDAVPWDEAERERVIDEVLRAYRFNTEVFEELQERRATSAA